MKRDINAMCQKFFNSGIVSYVTLRKFLENAEVFLQNHSPTGFLFETEHCSEHGEDRNSIRIGLRLYVVGHLLKGIRSNILLKHVAYAMVTTK